MANRIDAPAPQVDPQNLPARNRMEILDSIFDQLALKDQQAYYLKKIDRNRKAAGQVNAIRAFFAFLGGTASAAAGLVALLGTESDWLVWGLVFLAVASPGLGAAFGALNSIFEWDRHMAVYEQALESVQVTDALSPRPTMDDAKYYMYLQAYADASLDIMSEETSQFGNMVRSSQEIEAFLNKSRARAESVQNDVFNQFGISPVFGDETLPKPPEE